ncbi:hypothetical protein QBZ16_003126 [Prototheca wickerhamii]|uniref:Uncharacterized protein n=1 Tax=Prototheca wickerhamii TaxID=3111 RepID=A0AAD9ILP0_PROWI|nr:hypothetical protein QBZ16_003126 [Prototheca wickerhamii]
MQVYHFSPKKDYTIALAHTRQTAHVERAIGFQADGEPARAMAELGRALAENRACRQPIMTTSCSQEQLDSLYRLHALHTEDPSDYATMLQLRMMLNVPTERGERIEREVAEQAGAFCI